MDPDACLERIRSLIAKIGVIGDHSPDVQSALGYALAVELSEAVEDLDHWLVRGGFLPSSWSPTKRRRT